MQELKKKGESLNSVNSILNHHFSSKLMLTQNNKDSYENRRKPLFDFSSGEYKYISKESLIYVHASKRNTRISFCNEKGSHIFSYTMGSLGNKKSKRGNIYFVKDLCMRFLQELDKYDINSFTLCINGFGRARRPIIRFFSKTKLRHKCSYILDVTTKSHNGCRLRASRRL
jgi:ribosomal protein S11